MSCWVPSTEYNPQIHPRKLTQQRQSSGKYVISGFHLFTFLTPVCLSLFLFTIFINVNSLLFIQSPCEYSPCRKGAPCLPQYRSNGYFCMPRPGNMIEQGRIKLQTLTKNLFSSWVSKLKVVLGRKSMSERELTTNPLRCCVHSSVYLTFYSHIPPFFIQVNI